MLGPAIAFRRFIEQKSTSSYNSPTTSIQFLHTHSSIQLTRWRILMEAQQPWRILQSFPGLPPSCSLPSGNLRLIISMVVSFNLWQSKMARSHRRLWLLLCCTSGKFILLRSVSLYLARWHTQSAVLFLPAFLDTKPELVHDLRATLHPKKWDGFTHETPHCPASRGTFYLIYKNEILTSS